MSLFSNATVNVASRDRTDGSAWIACRLAEYKELPQQNERSRD